MRRVAVDSSMIRSVGYEAAARELEVEFNSGAVWRYRDVPQSVYDELLAAASKGQYMNDCVIDVYPDHQVSRGRR